MDNKNSIPPENSQTESELINQNVKYVMVQPDTGTVKSQLQDTTVLVVEDDIFYFSFIESILTSPEYNLIHAKDGQEAVDIFQANKDIKLILMDIHMPEMDGYTATEEIRKWDEKIPIIVQSSFHSVRIKEKAFMSGCNDFLLKPVNPEVLVHMIENYLKPTEENFTVL